MRPTHWLSIAGLSHPPSCFSLLSARVFRLVPHKLRLTRLNICIGLAKRLFHTGSSLNAANPARFTPHWPISSAIIDWIFVCFLDVRYQIIRNCKKDPAPFYGASFWSLNTLWSGCIATFLVPRRSSWNSRIRSGEGLWHGLSWLSSGVTLGPSAHSLPGKQK